MLVDIVLRAVDIVVDIVGDIVGRVDIAAWVDIGVDIVVWVDIAAVSVFARAADNCYLLLLLFYQKYRAIFLLRHRVWPVLTYPKLMTLQKHHPVVDVAVYPFKLAFKNMS